MSQFWGSLPSRHSVDDLVADLNHIRQHSGVAKSCDRVSRVLEYRSHQFRMRLPLPRFRDRLLSGIRPVVGVAALGKLWKRTHLLTPTCSPRVEVAIFENRPFNTSSQMEVVMKVERAGIYTRVSTTDQHPEIQEHELVEYVARRGWTQYRIYCDKGISGATERRPGLDALLEDWRRGKIDVVVVWKFDRFARSLKQLLNALDLFRRLGVAFVSCTEAIDTSLPHGEMLFQIIGAIAQWERSLIVERVKAGLDHARRQGKRLGRPPRRVLTREEIAKLRKERVVSKTPFRILAQKWGVTVFTAHTICGRKVRYEKMSRNL